ncbi:hypothetical protein SKAU_G00398110 [Synaphobranchus kaupii]|uniref:MIF4G domain-containing protein n=1 Tax=Synaphobranchus kaupii TaxID=118154 RepID=A0A9Q1IC38_SYNKA|nr:hypothetical protein SKAU_G00398110 [Synaphobranchus kaupii]
MEEESLHMKVELEAKVIAYRRRTVGAMKVLGELFKLNMVRDVVILGCVGTYLNTQSEEALECLFCLITTTGAVLDCKNVKEGKTTSRVRFMLQDVMDLRQNNWVPRRYEQGPKIISQVHEEAELEIQLGNMQLLSKMDQSTISTELAQVEQDQSTISTEPAQAVRDQSIELAQAEQDQSTISTELTQMEQDQSIELTQAERDQSIELTQEEQDQSTISTELAQAEQDQSIELAQAGQVQSSISTELAQAEQDQSIELTQAEQDQSAISTELAQTEPAVEEDRGQEDAVSATCTTMDASQSCQIPIVQGTETLKVISSVSFSQDVKLHVVKNAWRPSIRQAKV